MVLPDGNPAISVEIPDMGEGLEPSPHASPHAVSPSNSLRSEEQAALGQESANAIDEAQSVIVAEDGNPFRDIGYETDQHSSGSVSLNSLAKNFVYENGRRYHKFREGRYNFPNDEREQEREEMKHGTIVSLCQTLHFAPIIKDPQHILDMGTGTGIWAIEMADRYPSASVLGVDLSPIQPNWVPPNVRFVVDDVEDEWIAPMNYYDYIHARHTVMAFRDWPSLIKNVFDHLKPGAWFELQEVDHFPQCHDGTLPADHSIVRYWNLIADGLATLGLDIRVTTTLADKLRAAGFVHVTERIFHIPIGPWPRNQVLKNIGQCWLTNLVNGVESIALAPLTRGLKWELKRVEELLVLVREGYADATVHAHMPLHIIYGQRPAENGPD